jgi:glyoxylate reductase
VAGRVFITQPIPEPGPSLVRQFAEDVAQNGEDRVLPTAELCAEVTGRDGVLCLLTDRIDASVLHAAQGCRIVANMAVGYNNVDVAEATRLGIMVTNTPGVLTEATADLTWTLILGVARRVAEGDREMRAGRFPGWGPLYMLGGDVTGRTLGLVGPGRIATAVAERARGFRMPLLYCGRRPSPDLDALGARSVTLDTLLAESDFVSLHVPLSPETRHLIDAKALARMKSTAYLINTARGPVVDEAALVDALKEGRIAGAGLDVYEDEPRMAPGLADCPNALLLPHLGSATIATRAAMSRMAAENLVTALRGERPPNLVNPETWPGAKAKAHGLLTSTGGGRNA